MCAYTHRGKRVAYDNIAVGSVAGIEKVIAGDTTSPTSYQTFMGAPGLYGGGSNIANAEVPGTEDTENSLTGKMTSEVVED